MEIKTELAPEFDLPNCDTSITESSREHTLTGYGDISLTNIYFVPGLSSGIYPARSPLHTPKRNAPRLRPKASPFRADRPLPSVIQKVLPPSPSKAKISPEEDFDLLVEKMRSHQSKSLIRSALSSPSKKYSSSASPHRDVKNPTNQHNGIRAKEATGQPMVHKGLDLRAPSAPLPPPARLAPKPKERPFRGNAKLPRRLPLPRWDLRDPAVYDRALKDPGSLLESMPRKLMHRA